MEVYQTFSGTPAQFGAACETAAALLAQRGQPINLTVSPEPVPLHADLVRVRITSQDWQRHLWITVQRVPSRESILLITAEAVDGPEMLPEWERLHAVVQTQGWIMGTIPRGRLPL